MFWNGCSKTQHWKKIDWALQIAMNNAKKKHIADALVPTFFSNQTWSMLSSVLKCSDTHFSEINLNKQINSKQVKNYFFQPKISLKGLNFPIYSNFN